MKWQEVYSELSSRTNLDAATCAKVVKELFNMLVAYPVTQVLHFVARGIELANKRDVDDDDI